MPGHAIPPISERRRQAVAKLAQLLLIKSPKVVQVVPTPLILVVDSPSPLVLFKVLQIIPVLPTIVVPVLAILVVVGTRPTSLARATTVPIPAKLHILKAPHTSLAKLEVLPMLQWLVAKAI